MTNSWSLLSDTMSEYNNDVTILGGEANDTITFSGGNVTDSNAADYFDFWGTSPEAFGSWGFNTSPDTLSFSTSFTNSKVFSGTDTLKPSKNQKYSEDKILKELKEYIDRTYNQHYSAGDDKIQTLDLIEACGDGESFCRSNILKYASRYDKKGTARHDILKILHYAVLLMHFNDKNAQREIYPQ